MKTSTTPLQAGIMLTTAHPSHWTQTQVFDYATASTLAAEQLGYDDAWVLEHHFTPYGLCPNTFSMAGYLLGQTTRINIGTAVTVAPIDHPVRIAEQVCLLDQLSHGRFITGLGRGFFPQAFEAFGVDPAESHQRLQEWAAILRQACTERTIAWDSELIKLPDAVPYPEPFTRPHPPIYTVAVSPSTVEWAAAAGLPMMIQLPFEMETLRSQLELYDAAAAAAGREPGDPGHVLAILAHVADDRETAQQEIVDNLTWWTREGDEAGLSIDMLKTLPNYRYHYGYLQSAILKGAATAEDVVRSLLDTSLVGPPDFCVERLRSLQQETGITHFAFAFEGLLDHQRIIETMGRFATEVLARV